ncbi:dicarboxylate/amino acid:cation symporter [Bacteroides sp. 214]|uniref:dicarboxylate/amino acid:cation symporter n=1 Tax=Bacteroides sp. 214 TaxID=2302935 RepID=UPI0013D24ACA|nr:dicarboxylate/amino acid:cation symporter [Bacteroides sp. 214]NDW11281.1 dicarboxylate/amino acid:cation symporter [Bacteroides sp. 214]
MNILKNYASSLLLLAGVITGGVCGIIFGEKTAIVKPIGDIFLNLMFVLIVPLVFFSISSAICNIKKNKMMGRVIGSTMLVFLLMSIVVAVLGYLFMMIYNPLQDIDKSQIVANMPEQDVVTNSLSGSMIVQMLTVPDFLELFNKSNLLPLIVFSILFGLAVSLAGEKGEKVSTMLDACSEVIMKAMTVIMYAAPIGLGCYFADTVGSVGSQVIGGYMHVFILYMLLTFICFFGLNSLYMFLAGGKKTLVDFWKNILTPSLTAIATASSSACIPINIEASKKIGVPAAIAETVVPLGTNIHKDGSVMNGVIKIMFLFTLFGHYELSIGTIFLVIGVSLFVGAVVGAIPSGGMTGEILICSAFGFSPELVVPLIIISTICDVPATLINSTSNITGAVLTSRLSGGKEWFKHTI